VNLAAGSELPGALPGGFRQMPEYLVAWELEVWKKVRCISALEQAAPLLSVGILFQFSRTCSLLAG
jgi:hypothetical protein